MIGKSIGGYRITAKIGQGGMGTVYAARHEQLPKLAAVKVLSTAVAQDNTQVDRFFTEAQAISLLQHPSIVTLYDYGQMADGTVYMLMELLIGPSLKEQVEKEPLTLAKILQVISQVALALAVVHQQGIVHRDLKPANIMLIPSARGEQVKILDFGVAKFVQSIESRSVPGTVLGTPAYMAPEQCEGSSAVSDRADVYALGIIAYELLTGQYPYSLKGQGLQAFMRAHLEQPILPLHPLVPELPREIAELIREMLDKEPERRPSMEGVALRLGSELGEVKGLSRSPPRLRFDNPITATGQQPARQFPLSLQSLRVAAQATFIGRPRSRYLLLSSAVAVLALLGLAGNRLQRWLTSRSFGSKAAPTAPTGMRYLAGGQIRLGSTPQEITEALRQCLAEYPCKLSEFERELNGPQLHVAPFFLDAYEVTNEQFADWLNHPLGKRVDVEHSRYARVDKVRVIDLHPAYSDIRYDSAVASSPRFWTVADRSKRPVVQVTWAGAQGYCKSLGHRLPIEAEWEFAARGTARRLYPWGSAPPWCSGVVIGRWKAKDGPGQGACWGRELRVQPVGSASQDVSPDGIYDLGGNAEEWVDAVWSSPYQSPEPEQGADNHYRVVRGGGWSDTISSARGSGRTRWDADKGNPNIGFRCATGTVR